MSSERNLAQITDRDGDTGSSTTSVANVARCRVSFFDCVRIHDETRNRFVSPLTLSFVQIPGVVWPNLFVGCESSSVNNDAITMSVYKQSVVDMSRTDTEFRFLRDFWFELIRVCSNNTVNNNNNNNSSSSSSGNNNLVNGSASDLRRRSRQNDDDREDDSSVESNYYNYCENGKPRNVYSNGGNNTTRNVNNNCSKRYARNTFTNAIRNNNIYNNDLLRYFDARSLGSFSWTALTGSNPYVYFILLQTVRRMTRCRINFLNNHRYRVDSIDRPLDDQSDRNEFVDACLPCLFNLGASRLTLSQRMQRIVDDFATGVKQLRVSIVDMKQCENLLRQTIRSYYENDLYGSTSSSTALAVQSFDHEKALQDVSAQDVVVTLKKYVAFVSALQTRKWRTIDESARLTDRLKRYERTRHLSNDSSIASDVYRVLVEQLKNERSNVMHLSQQLCAMRKIIDNTRRLLVEIYNRMYVTWDETNDLTVKLRDTLRSYRVEPPSMFREYLQRDVYVLDFFRCFELIRSTNMILMKRIEDAYEESFDRALSDMMREVRFVGNGNDNNSSASSSSNDCNININNYVNGHDDSTLFPVIAASLPLGSSIVERVTVDTVLSALNDLNRWILLTREHYARNEWVHGPMDIRRMVLAFNRVIDLRLALVSRALNDYDYTDTSTLGIETIVDRSSSSSFPTNGGQSVPLVTTAATNVGGDVDGNNDRNRRETNNNNNNNNSNNTENNENRSSIIFRGANDAVTRTLNKRELLCARSLFEERFIIGQRQTCRPIGSIVVLLRETQDAYDVVYLTRMLDVQFDRLLAMRYGCGNSRVDRDSENAKWDERRMLKELEQATRSTFKQTDDTWDRLITRVRMYERETTFDTETRDGMKPRELLSTRLEEWCFRSLDSFNFTQIQARFTNLDRPGELSVVQKTVSRYAYLLSWLLQMRMYVPFDAANRSVIDTDNDDDDDDEDDDDIDDDVDVDAVNEYDDDVDDIVDDVNDNGDNNSRVKSIRGKRTRFDTDRDDDNVKRAKIDSSVVIDGRRNRKRGYDNDVQIDNNVLPNSAKRRRLVSSGGVKRKNVDDTLDDDSVLKRRRTVNDDYDDTIVNRDEVMGTTRIGLNNNNNNNENRNNDVKFDETGDVVMRNNEFPRRRRRRANKRRRGERGDNRDEDDDPLVKRSRVSTSNLTRLQRLAENAPHSISVRLLNDAFRDETAKKREIRSNIRKTLNRVVSAMRPNNNNSNNNSNENN